MRQVGSASAEHERVITACLDDEERQRLHALLSRIADDRGLNPGGHPGYRRLSSCC
ncbi:hypothetical protein [Salinifilum ghardaiensis]